MLSGCCRYFGNLAHPLRMLNIFRKTTKFDFHKNKVALANEIASFLAMTN
jgi:hypothetical protein